ncbi:MAG: dihydropteroate synthase [Lachnospiraceae bacterium]|nr:dihydropteroate synthase [Lachnospiraceae bacterium]
MIIGNREFDTLRHTYVFGILNVTPDSFSDGGKWNDVDRALYHVESMIQAGMDVLDVGGESTRPGYVKVPVQEEIERVAPVIRAVKERFDIPVSLDTYKAEVAKAGIEAGADLINDIWGLKADDQMARVIADGKVACCLMHNREEAKYDKLMPDVIRDLEGCLELAKQAGIPREKIMIDPGVGFGKTYEDNLEVLARLEDFQVFGLPVLLGTSRKSVIGLTLDLPADQREEGTLVTTVLAVMKGISFVRVHDVEKNVRAIKMAEAIRERTIR